MNDQQKIELLRKALVDAEARMTRARMILTDKNPRPECNWGVLDTTSVILPALSATATPPADVDRRNVWYGLLVKGTRRFAETFDTLEEAERITKLLGEEHYELVAIAMQSSGKEEV